MQSVKKPIEEKAALLHAQFSLLPVETRDLQLIRSAEQVSVFCRGFCFCTYAVGDRFARNYCLVQLHVAGKVTLVNLSRLFGLSMQHCSNTVVRYRAEGMEGLLEQTHLRYGNRKKIDKRIGELIEKLREEGRGYREIGQVIRFRYRKQIQEQTLRAWMCKEKKEGKREDAEEISQECLPLYSGEETESVEGKWHFNSYAGSMMLYAALEWSGWFRSFERGIVETAEDRESAWGVRRVMLTLFFLHALRCKSIEQGKHLVGRDFSEVIGGKFLRLQGLRYAVDEMVSREGFDRAMDGYYRDLMELLHRRDRIYYTDGHFSTYYGKRKIPKGYDPSRQQGFAGRNTIFVHNSQGSIVYLFESPANKHLTHDIEILSDDMERLGVELKRKTLIFDRGGYSQACFRNLKSKKKMYFVTYLKYRNKEREIPLDQFVSRWVTTEEGEEIEYKVLEKERRWSKAGKLRIIVFVGNERRQIPIVTSHPYLKPETLVYLLQRRWREENCFKYMTEHFGIDLLTTYKTEEAPDHVVKRAHPERQKTNVILAKKKNELKKLQSELGHRLAEREKPSSMTVAEFLEEENELRQEIQYREIDIAALERTRKSIPSKIEVNLKAEHVIIAQKRRMLINAIKTMNYNAEKWLQEELKPLHSKRDETLSMLRNLWRQPGEIQVQGRTVHVRLTPLDSGPMRASIGALLKKLQKNNRLRLPDGRFLTVTQTH